MKLGFSTVVYEEANLRFYEIVDKASTFGYEGIELNFRERPSDLNVHEMVDALKVCNVKIAAIGTRHMNVTHGLYLASSNGHIRKQSISYIIDCMRLSVELDCPLIQVGWAFQGSKLKGQFDATWENAVLSLKMAGKHADDYGLSLAIEYHNRYEADLINNMDEALRILDEVGLENVLINADTFHMNIEEASIEESICRAKSRLGYVHFSDSNRLAPGWGHMDFGTIISALNRINYDGYLTIECIPEPSADKALKQAIDFIERLL